MVGSHGKTSVSGRLAWALKECGFESSHLVGASLKLFVAGRALFQVKMGGFGSG